MSLTTFLSKLIISLHSQLWTQSPTIFLIWKRFCFPKRKRNELHSLVRSGNTSLPSLCWMSAWMSWNTANVGFLPEKKKKGKGKNYWGKSLGPPWSSSTTLQTVWWDHWMKPNTLMLVSSFLLNASQLHLNSLSWHVTCPVTIISWISLIHASPMIYFYTKWSTDMSKAFER